MTAFAPTLRRSLIRAVPGTGHPLAHPVATYNRDVEKAWQAVCAAQDAFAASSSDVDELLARKSAWVAAIDEYEAARLRHAEAVRRSQGRTGLRCIRGGGA